MLTEAGLKDNIVIERSSTMGSKQGSAYSGSGSDDTAEKESYIKELERKLKSFQAESLNLSEIQSNE